MADNYEEDGDLGLPHLTEPESASYNHKRRGISFNLPRW